MDKGRFAKKETKIKGFFTRFIEKVDKKMEEKAKNSKCCSGSEENGDNSCCS